MISKISHMITGILKEHVFQSELKRMCEEAAKMVTTTSTGTIVSKHDMYAGVCPDGIIVTGSHHVIKPIGSENDNS